MHSRTVFIFAHQDDEIFISSTIRRLARKKPQPTCYFLTRNPQDEINTNRNQESLDMLARMGLARETIVFIGDQLRVFDMELHLQLEKVYDYLFALLKSQPCDALTMYTPAWEGGHHDHDSCYVLATQLAKNLPFPTSVVQFFLYNGYRTCGPSFRVNNPIQTNNLQCTSLSLNDILRGLIDPWFYFSQRKSWMFLYLPWLFQLILKRREYLQVINPNSALEPPHRGRLLYERHGRISYALLKNYFDKLFTYIKSSNNFEDKPRESGGIK